MGTERGSVKGKGVEGKEGLSCLAHVSRRGTFEKLTLLGR
jgi:hypothetical protein